MLNLSRYTHEGRIFYRKVKRNAKMFLFITIPTLIFLFLFLEVIFYFVIPTSDITFAEFNPKIGLHLQANQTGTFVMGITGEVKGKFNINSEGWNSVHDTYTPYKNGNEKRIVVIGDSFVEALQVNIKDAYFSLLESNLNSYYQNTTIEVYSFGVSGWALSQYWVMLRDEIIEDYKPDLVIINIVHNDFYPSLTEQNRTPTGHFVQFKKINGSFIETCPIRYNPLKYRKLLAKSAMIRFFNVNIKPSVEGKIKGLYTRILSQNTPNRDITNKQSLEEDIKPLTEYVFSNMKNLTESHNSSLIIIMDADRSRIYPNKIETPYVLNTISKNTSQDLGIDFIDLTPYFFSDYQKNKIKFEFNIDKHWNQHAHFLVSEILASHIIKENRLSICSQSRN